MPTPKLSRYQEKPNNPAFNGTDVPQIDFHRIFIFQTFSERHFLFSGKGNLRELHFSFPANEITFGIRKHNSSLYYVMLNMWLLKNIYVFHMNIWFIHKHMFSTK